MIKKIKLLYMLSITFWIVDAVATDYLTKFNLENRSTNIITVKGAVSYFSPSNPVNVSEGQFASEGNPPSAPEGIPAPLPYPAQNNADLMRDAGAPASEIAATAIVVTNPETPVTLPAPSNRSIINAQSDTPLSVTLAALNGATYNFQYFSGAAAGGSFVNSNSTLNSTTATQDPLNIATGTLLYQFGNISGASSFANIELTGATIINVNITGATIGDYFTGTDFTAGSISQGNFDIVFVTFPVGTVFTITNGDLGTTGTFTTTAPFYAYLTGGLTTSTTITNGNLTQVGSVDGTFKYLGTDIPGGTLSALEFNTVNAVGTSSDANHFNASSADGVVADGTQIVINKNLATTTNGTLYINEGSQVGNLITGINGAAGTLNNGTFNAALTQYNNADITFSSPCIDGDINSTIYNLTPPSSAIVTLAEVLGTMSAGNNQLIFGGTQIVTGTINGLGGSDPDFTAGAC